MKIRSSALVFTVSALAAAMVPPSARADTPAPRSPASTLPPLPASPAPAVAAAGEDEVLLKNGGMIRGTITDLEPNSLVTIIVQGSGVAKTVPWSEIDHIDRGAHSTVAAPPPPAPPAAPPSPPNAPAGADLTPTELGLARIHIMTDDPQVQLHHYLGMAPAGYVTSRHGGVTPVLGTVSEVVCRTPCGEVIDGRKGDEFYFAGKGITPSAPFQVFDKQGDFTAEVHPGSVGKRVGGLFSVIGGGGLAAVGMMTLGLGAISEDQSFTTIGGVALGVGAVVLVAGIVMLVSSKTTYDLHPTIAGGATAPAPLPVVPPADACHQAEVYDQRAAAETGV